MAIVSAESACTQATIERPILGSSVIGTRDRRRLITALKLRAFAGRRARAAKRNAGVRACLRLGQLATGEEGNRRSERAEKLSSCRGADEASCQMVEG